MIFGTDGLRAKMGVHPLTQPIIETLSTVLNAWLHQNTTGTPATVVVGSDTRESCSQVRQWICSAFDEVTLIDLGVVPTPVVAYETQARDAQLGIMITASHNPAEDNGLKFFDAQGHKIRYDQAVAWSERVLDPATQITQGVCRPTSAEPTFYLDFLAQHFGALETTPPIAFDLAHGAGSGFFALLADRLKLKPKAVIGNQPNGTNINAGYGALHTEKLVQAVVEHQCLAGFALDGDGDRLIVVDADGPLHGDMVLYALGEVMQAAGHPIETVVGTIMCGMGFEQVLAGEGKTLLRTPVGDQNVLAEMIDRRLLLGGEPSGHLILGDLFPAGDGLLAAMRLIAALKHDPDLLRRARAKIPLYPVFEKAYRVQRKPPLDSVPALAKSLDALKDAVGNQGRLIVRYSGTENKIRVYLEAQDLTPFNPYLEAFIETIDQELA
ncbi:hypothetical protein [Acanthopleuribacter pedis]|uniref:Phosphoglucosamine mutase n=1 Tax=Acanthopleuribacter pedis TaxID=442870 RepID=A0A8J7Q9W8_9BACT|nr:hypothetical protein [Acanthopleuribacter pedis]MBO1319684.1 hypothetical protein [Acanthopleuribacter pedis]